MVCSKYECRQRVTSSRNRANGGDFRRPNHRKFIREVHGAVVRTGFCPQTARNPRPRPDASRLLRVGTSRCEPTVWGNAAPRTDPPRGGSHGRDHSDPSCAVARPCSSIMDCGPVLVESPWGHRSGPSGRLRTFAGTVFAANGGLPERRRHGLLAFLAHTAAGSGVIEQLTEGGDGTVELTRSSRWAWSGSWQKRLPPRGLRSPPRYSAA